MWIERTIKPELLRLVNQVPVIVLTGPRQVGKTTLLENTFPQYNYVTLDYAQNAEQAESNPAEFLSRYPAPLIIDEIQYVPSLLRHIKTAVDERKGEKGLYLITGSQSFSLMQSVSESLAGRAAVLTLHGLSHQEWAAAFAHSNVNNEDFLLTGGYPGLWCEPENPIDRTRWYQSYITTYLERDVRNILNIKRLRDFERFLRVCASRTGQILNMSDMARDVGISPTTAREWISVLEASHQIILLEPYYRSLGKRLTKSPKLYFCDTGLSLFLSGFGSLDSVLNSHHMGAYWENHVISQWLRWKHWHHPEAALWFWQDQSKNEVDLLIEKNGRLFPIECKWKEAPVEHDTRGIARFRSMYPAELVGHAFIACRTEQSHRLGLDIMAVNGWSSWSLDGTGGLGDRRVMSDE